MAKKKTQLTPQQKQAMRAVALKNLKSKLLALHFVNRTKSKDRDFGQVGFSLGHQTYLKYLNYSDIQNQIGQSLQESEIDGEEPYAGTITSHRIISDASKIIDESIHRVKVGDVANILGAKCGKTYKGMYVGDLAQQKNKKAKETYMTLLGAFETANMQKYMSEALGDNKKAIIGELEKLLV